MPIIIIAIVIMPIIAITIVIMPITIIIIIIEITMISMTVGQVYSLNMETSGLSLLQELPLSSTNGDFGAEILIQVHHP